MSPAKERLRKTRAQGKNLSKGLAISYVASLAFDQRLYQEDITGSIAHARMLARQGIISPQEADQIVSGLTSIKEEIQEGLFPWRDELEDVHMNIEARLTQKIGEVAGKLHTGRSRNDQVSVDLRLFLKTAICETVKGIRDLQAALLDAAEAHKDALMPGYTHLQRAQPVLLSHHLLAYFHMLQRDVRRFNQCFQRTDELPLGSGALAGVPYPVDRKYLAQELGFSRITDNSMDAVADRDFVLDYQSASAIAMMHLSRLAEELVLWSSQEFGFIALSPEYTTGSSIMPQKRNPDFAELARGKTGRVYGHLMALLTVLKGLPLTYNRDLQEDKEGLFDTVDTLNHTLKVFQGMVRSMQVNAPRMRQAAQEGYLLATDLADYLVSKGCPFRVAHGIVAKLVGYATEKQKGFHQLTLKEYQKYSTIFQQDVFSITPDSSIRARNVAGGTAPEQVERALEAARAKLEEANELLD